MITRVNAVEVKLNKHRKILFTRESWMKLVYSKKQADVVHPKQFNIKKTSSSRSGSELTEYFALNFKDDSKIIRIADGIKGKKAAKVLRNTLIERLFDDDQSEKAA